MIVCGQWTSSKMLPFPDGCCQLLLNVLFSVSLTLLLVIILHLVYNPLCCTGIYEWLYLFFPCYIFIFIDFSLTVMPLLETCGLVLSCKETPETFYSFFLHRLSSSRFHRKICIWFVSYKWDYFTHLCVCFQLLRGKNCAIFFNMQHMCCN